MKAWFMVILYSVLCGNLLVLFSWDPSILTRYIFSLGAILAGIHFFRKFEAKRLRISFIGLAIFSYFFFTVVFVIVGYIPIF